MESGEEGMIPVAKTHQFSERILTAKRSNQRSLALESCTLPTKLWDLAVAIEVIIGTNVGQTGKRICYDGKTDKTCRIWLSGDKIHLL